MCTEEAFCHELGLRGIAFQRQLAVDVMYKEFRIQGQRLDLIVENQVIVEIKALKILPDIASAQVLSYLKATGLQRGLLVNFGVEKLVTGIKRFSL